MKSFFKQIYNWTSLLFRSIVSLCSVLFFSSWKAAKELKKTARKNKHNTCIVLGNGPSMKETLDSRIDDLKQYDTIAVNTFCVHDSFVSIKPKYYVLTDPGFFDDKTSEERVLQLQNQVRQGLSQVDWQMVLLLPSINRKSSLLRDIDSRFITVCFYNVTPVDGFISLQHFLFNNNLGMPTAMSVVCAAIFLTMRLNYKDIYVVGADHNMIRNLYVNENNELMLSDEHFYEKKDIRIHYSICKYVEGYAVCMKTHERLAEYSSYSGVNVWNATKGSFIDAYPRRQFPSYQE